MAEIGKAFLRCLACFVLGAALACAGLYFTVIRAGDDAVRSGLVAVAGLKSANDKLQRDLRDSVASASELDRRLQDRQRVINAINGSVEKLNDGLSSGVGLIDDIIAEVRDIERILQNG